MLNRRAFTGGGLVLAAFSGLARTSGAMAALDEVSLPPSTHKGFGPLIPDPLGLIDLPAGFTRTVISQVGETMDDGHAVPCAFDGMGCFAADDGKLILVRNHELDPDDGRRGPCANGSTGIEKYFDCRTRDAQALPGGTSTLLYDPATGKVEAQRLSLSGTIRNCAGGVTPWGSWLSCEETTTRAGEKGVDQDHGWVFEVPASIAATALPQPIRAMGRFAHEAAITDPRTGIVYMTEDEDHSLFYRFIPTVAGNLHMGGRLQALVIMGMPGADTGNYPRPAIVRNIWLAAQWIDLTDVHNPQNDLARRGIAAGAARFVRAEGLHRGIDDFYFACTTGGAAKVGQVFRYRPSPAEGTSGEAANPGQIQLFIESGGKDDLYRGDNLAVAPWGDILLCEDNDDGRVPNRLRGITPAGILYDLGKVAPKAEPTGICFSPDGAIMFMNLHTPGRTLAITGPWI